MYVAFQLAQVLVVAVHLTAVNVAVGGTGLAMWLHVRAMRRSEPHEVLGPRLLQAALYGLYVGTVLGFAAAYLWWLSRPEEVEATLAILPASRYYFAAAELVFSAVCFEVWLRLWSRGPWASKVGCVLGFVGFTNLAYHFPTLFGILGVYGARPLEIVADRSYLSLLNDGEVIARVVHFLIASVAVAGTVLYALAAQCSADDGPRPELDRVGRRGALVALIATLLQWPIGVVYILAMPETGRTLVMGRDRIVAGLFVVSLFAVIGLTHKLAAAALGEGARGGARRVVAWILATILLMTAVRHRLREAQYPPRPDGVMIGDRAAHRSTNTAARRTSTLHLSLQEDCVL